MAGKGEGAVSQREEFPQKPPSAKKLILFSALLALLFLASVAGFFLFGDPEKTIEILGKINPIYLILLSALTFLSVALRVKRWDSISESVSGKKRPPFPERMKGLLVGLGAGLVTPAKSGEFLRILIYKKSEGIPPAKSLLLLFYERVFDVTVIILLALSYFANSRSGGKIALAAYSLGACVFLASALLFLKAPRRKLLSLFFRKTFRNESDLKEADEIFSAKALPKTSGYTLAIWLIEFLRISLTFLLITGRAINPLGIAQGFSLSIVIGVVSAIPGGVGAVELTSGAVYGKLGISATEAIAAVIVDRLVAFWPVALAGLALFPKFFLSNPANNQRK